MILSCPNCGTQYVVKDGAIPPEGRQVRCAACKHSWHQDPESVDPEGAAAPEMDRSSDKGMIGASASAAATASEVAAEPSEAMEQAPPDESETLAEATLIEPRSGPEAEQRAYEAAAIDEAATSPTPPGGVVESSAGTTAATSSDWNEPPTADVSADTFSPFADDDDLAPVRRSPFVAVLIVVLIIVVAAALFWFLAPTALKANLGITPAAATPLQLVTTHMDRTPLESGNELLTVTGRVINPSVKEQDVPPIQAQLKDHQGKVVYSWTIQPPAHSLAAGASASFNSAEVNVPPGGDELTITLGEPKT